MVEPVDTGTQTGTAAAAVRSHALISGGRRRWWMLVVCTILVLGLAFSFGGALLWRSSVRAHDKQTFQTAATDVAATTETQLRRDTDFVATLRTLLTREPGLGATGFARWFTDLEGLE